MGLDALLRAVAHEPLGDAHQARQCGSLPVQRLAVGHRGCRRLIRIEERPQMFCLDLPGSVAAGAFLGAHTEVAAQAQVLHRQQQSGRLIAPAQYRVGIRSALQRAAVVRVDDLLHRLLGVVRHQLRGRLLDDPLGDHRVAVLLGVTEDRHLRHRPHERRHPLHALLRLAAPGGADRRQPVGAGLVPALAQQQVATGVLQQQFAVATDVELAIGVDTGGAEHQQGRVDLGQVAGDDVVWLAVEQHRLHLDAVVVGDRLCHCQVTLVDLRQARIDDLLVQLLLLLELEHLAGLLGEHAGNAVEGDIVVVGVERGDHLDLAAPLPRQ